jgi:hypothetical protein
MKHRRYEPLYFLPVHLLPEGFQYPESYRAFAATGKWCVGPTNDDWCVIDEDDAIAFLDYARRLVPSRRLVPFMRRNGEDGVACFDGEASDEEPKIWGFNYSVDVGYVSGTRTFTEWLAQIPPEDEDEE